MASVFTGIVNCVSTLLGQGQGKGGGGGTKRGPSDTDENGDGDCDDKEPDSASADNDNRLGVPPREDQGQSAKKVKLSPPELAPSGSSSFRDNGGGVAAAVLKEELAAIQRNVITQIETLGQKVKDIEGKEKNLEEENKNLKDLLYAGSLENKNEKSKNESLVEQNKRLLSVLEKSKLDIERNLRESVGQLLEVADMSSDMLDDLFEKAGFEPQSPSTSLNKSGNNLQLLSRVSHALSPIPPLTLNPPSEILDLRQKCQPAPVPPPAHQASQSSTAIRPLKENVGENICSAGGSSPVSPSSNKLPISANSLHPDVARFFSDFEREFYKIQPLLVGTSLAGERGRKLIRDKGIAGIATAYQAVRRNRENAAASAASASVPCEKGAKCHHATQTEGKVRPSLTECGVGTSSPSASESEASASDASKVTAKQPSTTCQCSPKAAAKSDGENANTTPVSSPVISPTPGPAAVPSTSTAAAAVPSTSTSTSTADPPAASVETCDLTDEPKVAKEEGFDSLSFAKLSGLQDQVQSVRENVLFPLVNKEALLKFGVQPAKGLIFSGPLGSGKYLLAKTLCAEMNRALKEPIHFFRRRKTDIFPRYSDKGQKYLKKLFEEATAKAPSVIFLDDLDTLCGYVEGLGSEDAVVKCLAGHMDALKSNRVIVIGATLQFARIDASLRKRSRFEKNVVFPAPNADRRKAIMKAQSSQWNSPEEPDSDLLERMTKKSEGWSADDMKELCRQAYLQALHKHFSTISAADGGQTYKLDAGSIDSIKVLPEHWDSACSSIEKAKLAGPKGRQSCAVVEENIAPEVIDENLGFDSIGGLEEQMQNIRENILFPMLNKSALLDWGVEPVKGIIFHGPPGTGKTLLAKALAAELSRRGDQPFSFFYRKGTDSFQKYVGWTESYLRTLFAKAVAKKPAILFFDEIDGLCATRKDGSSTNFYNGIVTTMLGLMDGVTRGEIFVIAATNRLDTLDPAMTRPGRFDKAIAFFPPKEDGRKAILEIHSSKWKKGREEEILAEIAKQTEGYTGADLEQLCRQTFLSALRRQFPTLATDDYKMNSSQFEDFSILRQDWYTALGTVKGSNNKAFGNSISSGKAIPPGVSRLIRGIEQEIVAKLQPFLKAQTPVPGEEKGGGIKSFLIWDTGALQSRVIENFIVPSLISCADLKETTTFTFGDDKVECTLMKSLMAQVMSGSSGTKTAILYIPRMDLLITKLTTANSLHLFMEHMDSLRGENILLLASAGCPISELSEDFRLIFKGMADSRSYKLRKFEISECREFFSPILQEHYPQLLDRASLLGHAANFYDLLDLKSELSQACVSGKEKESSAAQVAQVLEGILDGFEANKLDHCGPRNHMYS